MRRGPICPKDVWQLFHPFSLRIIQPFLKSIHYDFIDSLNLSIPLGVSRGGISICNPQVTTVSSEGLAIKLQAVVRDKGTKDPKPSYNILPKKFLGIHVPDVSQWFSSNPLGEVICADQQVLLIPYGLRKRTYNIQAPLSEWPRAR